MAFKSNTNNRFTFLPPDLFSNMKHQHREVTKSITFFPYSTTIHLTDICFKSLKMTNFRLLGIVHLLLFSLPLYLLYLWIFSIPFTFSHWVFPIFILSSVQLLVIQRLFPRLRLPTRLWTLIRYAYMKEVNLEEFFVGMVIVMLCMKGSGTIRLCLQYFWHVWCKTNPLNSLYPML